MIKNQPSFLYGLESDCTHLAFIQQGQALDSQAHKEHLQVQSH